MIGDKIRRYRKAQRLTQTALAKQIGVVQSNVVYWEKIGGVPAEMIWPLARALGCHPLDLLDRPKRKPKGAL